VLKIFLSYTLLDILYSKLGVTIQGEKERVEKERIGVSSVETVTVELPIYSNHRYLILTR
jgi:hypothetical protein